jgi:hypothetical protein
VKVKRVEKSEKWVKKLWWKNFGEKNLEQRKMIGATVEWNKEKTESRMLISQQPCSKVVSG